MAIPGYNLPRHVEFPLLYYNYMLELPFFVQEIDNLEQKSEKKNPSDNDRI
jgi:hypothetical protein